MSPAKRKKSSRTDSERESPSSQTTLPVSVPAPHAHLAKEKEIYRNCLPFEKPIVELEKKIQELKSLSGDGIDLAGEIKNLEKKLEQAKKEVFSGLTCWQIVQVARHPMRPYTLDYINLIAEDFVEIYGDRLFSDDKAIVGGLARIEGRRVCVVGHQKGRDTKDNLLRSFGSAHPEGYRKAMRIMNLAAKFSLPIISLVDTPGAYPGIGAEERGQAEAIANNLKEMSELPVPIIVIVIGEGGSGGALGIGLGDYVMVMENAYYSVISPEGCAAILWKDAKRAPEAADALKLTARDLLELGVIDAIVPEPLGGAHRDATEAAAHVKSAIEQAFKVLAPFSKEDLVDRRYNKFRRMGVYKETKVRNEGG